MITAIGVTIFEAQYLEVPSIVISNYEEDRLDEEKLKEWGGVTILGRYDKVELSKIVEAI